MKFEVETRDGQLQLGVGVNSGVDTFFKRVGVELELNFLIHRWSWSGVKFTRSGVGVELSLLGVELEWS
jgi:hypothetical protein